ncbi:phenol hydroxylase [Nitrogeniibacter mangrovi]|uniref:Phenol hydroxylase n=1 Tax=Nitrogeniibacter mangrovi TaxID=2016596 RepID=A0A6C1B1X6_9RHOO|nr:phenol hydroxylase subunit P4 [Nitrogeniibacter mangrovi]QID17632.1 phenol hydroxylase [Nitrogeniibacter mangrovi]
MAVAAVKEYTFESADRLENFHGNQLLFVGWEDHLLFCAPFALAMPPTTLFGDLVGKMLPGAFGYHPDFAKIDWNTVEWFKSGEPWQPQMDASLADNGLGHKAVIRFRTPGLTGIKGSCS